MVTVLKFIDFPFKFRNCDRFKESIYPLKIHTSTKDQPHHCQYFHHNKNVIY